VFYEPQKGEKHLSLLSNSKKAFTNYQINGLSDIQLLTRTNLLFKDYTLLTN